MLQKFPTGKFEGSFATDPKIIGSFIYLLTIILQRNFDLLLSVLHVVYNT